MYTRTYLVICLLYRILKLGSSYGGLFRFAKRHNFALSIGYNTPTVLYQICKAWVGVNIFHERQNLFWCLMLLLPFCQHFGEGKHCFLVIRIDGRFYIWPQGAISDNRVIYKRVVYFDVLPYRDIYPDKNFCITIKICVHIWQYITTFCEVPVCSISTAVGFLHVIENVH